MSPVSAVLYLGDETGALDLADAFADGDAPAVLTVSDAAAVPRLLDDDRLDCVVCADADLADAAASAGERRPGVPVVSYGVALDGDVTAAVDGDAGADALAARVRAAVESDAGTPPSGDGAPATRERVERVLETTRALEAAPIGVCITDPDRPDNPLVYVNEAFTELTGYDAAAATGRNCRFLQGEGTDPEPVARMREAIDAGEPVQVDVLNYRQDGTPFWNRVDVAPVRDDDGAVTNFVGFQRDVTDRKEREERLRSLNETAHAMMLAATDAEIADLAVGAASDVLDLPLTVLWRYSEAEEAFTVVARSAAAAERFDRATLPVEADEGLSARDTPLWTAFESGTIQAVGDAPAADGASDLALESGIAAPLSEYGVLVTGSTATDAFDDRDADLFRILAATTESALLRARRERQLQRQNERLDDFVGVVSHDLRNPLQVATARLEAYFETGERDHLEHVRRNHDRMGRIVEDVLALAREGRTVTAPEQVHLAAVARQAWETVEHPAASLEMATSATLVADPDRLQRMFENLFRNAVEHGTSGERVAGEGDAAAGSGDSSDAGVTVRVGTTEMGFYVADDGPGVPAEERAAVFEKGYTTSETGTGFGLSIVRSIAESHGWTVTLGESDAGGLRLDVNDVSTLTSTG